MWISKDSSKHLVSSVEILVNMFTANEYDLVVTLDDEHFAMNADVVDQFHTGSVIEFEGHVRRIAS